MVPRLVTLKGKPERSFCPFCGGVHLDFRTRIGQAGVGALLGIALGSILS